MKATLDALSDNPTEEEAEAALQACGTSGKEVVNGFIERLLRERSEMQAELNRLRATPATPSDAAMRAAEERFIQEFTEATIEAHVGFHHEKPYHECDYDVCARRREMIDHAAALRSGEK